MCPPPLGTWPATQACDWESNQQPFGSQASVQSTEPHQPGLPIIFSDRISVVFQKGTVEQEGTRKLLEVMDIFTIMVVVLVAEMYTCVRIY